MYIRPSSDHFRYAQLIALGDTHAAACQKLGITTRQAKRWRDELRAAARREMGMPLSYDVAVLHVFAVQGGLKSPLDLVRTLAASQDSATE